MDGVPIVEREVHGKKNPPWAAVEAFEHYVGDVRFLGGILWGCGLNIGGAPASKVMASQGFRLELTAQISPELDCWQWVC